MPTPLEDADFLTRSENRVRLLEHLVDESRSRSELQERMDVARLTLTRLIDGLTERGWIHGNRQEYRITVFGELVLEDLQRMLETVSTSQKLRDLAEYAPINEFDFDLRRLATAHITYPTQADTLAPLNRTTAAFRDIEDRSLSVVSAVTLIATQIANKSIDKRSR